MVDRKIIELEQGWKGMEVGITKLKDILEGSTEQKFVSEEYINLYTYVTALPPLCVVAAAVVAGSGDGSCTSPLEGTLSSTGLRKQPHPHGSDSFGASTH